MSKTKLVARLLTAVALSAMIQAGYTATYFVTDLTPQGALRAEVDGMASGQLVGRVTVPSDGYDHAFLWRSAGAPVDLHPPGFRDSWAWDTSGDHQVGLGYSYLAATDHALLWAGSSGSII